MFHFNRDDFRRRDEAQLAAFISCWGRYYRGAITISPTDASPINYEGELNIEHDLTRGNVVRILRWKDPRMLTHPKADGTANRRVEKVLDQLGAINHFRNGRIDQHSFARIAASVFRNGIVWQLFLFHMARPWEWPIADRHVFKAHSALFGHSAPKTLAEFEQYRENFTHLAQVLHGTQDVSRIDMVRRNKRLDGALMSYGQFLLKYDR